MISSSDATRPQLVLIVGEDEDTCEMYKLFLMRHRYIVETAGDGQSALVKAMGDVPDIIVTETRLGGINGCALCLLLRAEPDMQKVPIIVLTGDARPGQLNLAWQSGANAILTKPCLPETLLATLQRIHQPSRAAFPGMVSDDSTSYSRFAKSARRGPSRGAEIWRLQKAGRIATCELKDDIAIGAGWDVLLLHDGQIRLSKRCPAEEEAMFVAQRWRQVYVVSGYDE